MLEKLNSISYHNDGIVVKQIVDLNGTTSERITLQTLNMRTNGHITFLVPNVYVAKSSSFRVCMTNIPGIRVNELIAILNKIIQTHQTQKVYERALNLKTKMIDWALADLRFLQSDKVQKVLINNLGEIVQTYDFYGKFMEALNYVSFCMNIEISTKTIDEISYICEFLSKRSTVTFRDAILKNRIFQLPESIELQQGYETYNAVCGDYQRPTNWQISEVQPIVKILEILGDSYNLKDQTFNLDFESAYMLTTPQDDYLHIIASEGNGFEYKDSEVFWSKELGLTEEEYNYALLFRYFREWVRKLFYKYERPEIYPNRYRHETLLHNFNTAFDALTRLRQNVAAPLDNFYDLVHSCDNWMLLNNAKNEQI